MKNSEVVDLLELIDRVYKTDYAKNKDIVSDWFKVLRNYDFNDITKSIDYYMENYTEYPPKVYNLTKGYQTIETKHLLDHAKTRCIFCGKKIDFNNTKHEDRCRSVEYIKSAVRRFKNQEIDIDRYRTMNEEEFNHYYLAATKLIIDNSSNQMEVNLAKRYMESL